ncbi:MAG TPA: UvrD-helicase domain-containing protein, partial [Ktedonobacterales bacterium]
MEDLLRARLVASHLLHWWRERSSTASSVATPLEELAAALGLEVATFAPELHPGTLGFLEPGEDLIFLRAGLSEPVRRFTLAHELGHALLHRSSGTAAALASQLTGSANAVTTLDSCGTDDLEAPLDLAGLGDETLRPGQAYSARARRESEANAFAAALLLPADALRDVYVGELSGKRARSRPDITARSLAERFGVSEDVALRRLGALLTPGYEQLERQTELLASLEHGAQAGSGAGQGTLDDDQRAAAQSATPALIVAGPGTGKTSTLVGRVAYLVRDEGASPSSILALTFSNKAAREMRERLALLLADTPIPSDENGAPAPLTLPQVGTIHAFCGELLRQYAPRVGLRPDFRLVTQTEGYFLLRRLSANLDLSYYQPLGAPAMYFPDLLAAISRAKDELVDPERYAELAQAMQTAAHTSEQRVAAARAMEVAQVYAAYQQALAARGDPDFGDVVRLCVKLLQEHPDVLAEVRSRYVQVLVDEFQDINRAMGVLLQTLAGARGPLWAVGDPDQAIYRFRGASPANIARFDAEYPGAQVRRLGRNYRSYRPILDVAHAVAETFIPGVERPQLHATRGSETDGSATGGKRGVTLAVAADDAAELDGLVVAIQARHAAGRALLDQAVLCRTRRGAQRAVATLQAAGIPTRVVAPLLEQDDVKDLLAVVSLLADGSGAGLLRAGANEDHAYTREDARCVLDAAHEAHLSPLALLSRASLADLGGITRAGREGLSSLAEMLPALRSSPDVATGLSRYVFSLTDLGRRLLLGLATGDLVLSERAHHLARVLALAHAFEDQQRAAELPIDEEDAEEQRQGVRVRVRRTGAAWAEFLEYVRVLSVLRQEVGGADDALASADDGVWVLTVHASKGLEFPVVYLPMLSERRFPVQRQYVATPPPHGLLDDKGTPDEEAHLAEEACLFYVALTRARDELVLSVAERYGRVKAKPSRFLKPIADRLGEELSHARWLPVEQRKSSLDRRTKQHEEGATIPPEPIGIAELETYQRCPRQYAYSYVYGLRSQGGGLGLLNRSVQEALRELQLLHDTSAQGYKPVTLDDARGVFDRAWEIAHSNGGEVAGPY